jgi:SAM-dependent methyltransferase
VKQIFQPLDGPWREHAGLGVLRSVLEPLDADNRKNNYLHSLHTQAVKSILPEIQNLDMLDFGCGTGRFSLLLSEKARPSYLGKYPYVDYVMYGTLKQQ